MPVLVLLTQKDQNSLRQSANGSLRKGEWVPNSLRSSSSVSGVFSYSGQRISGSTSFVKVASTVESADKSEVVQPYFKSEDLTLPPLQARHRRLWLLLHLSKGTCLHQLRQGVQLGFSLYQLGYACTETTYQLKALMTRLFALLQFWVL